MRFFNDVWNLEWGRDSNNNIIGSDAFRMEIKCSKENITSVLLFRKIDSMACCEVVEPYNTVGLLQSFIIFMRYPTITQDYNLLSAAENLRTQKMQMIYWSFWKVGRFHD